MPIFVTPSRRIIFVIFDQPANASSEISPPVTVISNEYTWSGNALSILSKADAVGETRGNDISIKLEQFQKALLPIFETLIGILIPLKRHPSKARPSILITPSGIAGPLRDTHPAKAE